ncbi:hypothetical protein EG328_005677 [Venturia inaequalis]|uniref:DUF6590 domain-containing protein n=1 Tax=Venturia inaequalis TaxID=5025 RepID=A0A8H3VET6_VENIN|nr:hypothetical protein EG328_005677 [Venturia inaequalis]
MATPQSGWVWDGSRKDYCYWVAAERCWQYQSGIKLYTADDATPRAQAVQPTVSSQVGYGHSQPATNIGTSPVNDTNYTLTNAFSGMNVGGQEQQPSQYTSHSQPVQIPKTALGGWGYNSDYVQRNFEAYPHVPYQNITQEGLLQYNMYASMKVKETPEPEERLDPRYKIQKRSRGFFTVGKVSSQAAKSKKSALRFDKVFLILWPELAGDGARDDRTLATIAYGEKAFTKIRWFVVIVEGHQDCSCLPIQTYQGQGVAKSKTVKNNHAIIFTGKKAPMPNAAEIPDGSDRYELGMRDAIRVKQKNHQEKMEIMSRLNYRKIYTVEHNVKVREFGQVHKDHEERLVSNFYEAWGFAPRNASSAAEAASVEDEDEDDEEEEQEPSGKAFQAEAVQGAAVEDEEEEDMQQAGIDAQRRRDRRASEHTRSSGKGKGRRK